MGAIEARLYVGNTNRSGIEFVLRGDYDPHSARKTYAILSWEMVRRFNERRDIGVDVTVEGYLGLAPYTDMR